MVGPLTPNHYLSTVLSKYPIVSISDAPVEQKERVSLSTAWHIFQDVNDINIQKLCCGIRGNLLSTDPPPCWKNRLVMYCVTA